MTMNGDSASSNPRLRFFAGLVPLTILLVVSGVLHLLWPEPYLRIMPPFLPWPKALVWISGVAEIAGGIGLLLPKFRRAAAYGLVALLIAVFPANVYMAVAHVPFSGLMGASWAQWLRLPLQIPLILWALYYARKDAPIRRLPVLPKRAV
jgi:uncharacterized membrane protein